MEQGCFFRFFFLFLFLPSSFLHSQNPLPKILIVSNFDPNEVRMRKNKKEVYYRLTDSLMSFLKSALAQKGYTETEVIYGITRLYDTGQHTIYHLMKEHKAGQSVVINDMKVFFNQTNVEVTRSEETNNKNREAYYEICSSAFYSFYSDSGRIRNDPVDFCRPHSSRWVMSGLLSAGPNLVNKEGDAREILRTNVFLYMDMAFRN